MVNKRSISSTFAAFCAFPGFPRAGLGAHAVGFRHSGKVRDAANGQYTATVTVTANNFGGTVEYIPSGQNVPEAAGSTDEAAQQGQPELLHPGEGWHSDRARELRAAAAFHLARQRPGDSVLRGHDLRSGDVRAPEQLDGRADDRDDHRAGERLHAASELSERPDARQRHVRTSDELPDRADPDRWHVRAAHELPQRRDPLRRGVRTARRAAPAGRCSQAASACHRPAAPAGRSCPAVSACRRPIAQNGETLARTASAYRRPTARTARPCGRPVRTADHLPERRDPVRRPVRAADRLPRRREPDRHRVRRPTIVVPPAKTYPGVCRASTEGYRVRAGQEDTIIVSVTRHGIAVAGSKVRITLPGGKTVSRTTGKNGKATFTVAPTQSGTIFVRSPSCKEMAKVKVFAAKAATVQRAPSFTG